MTLPDKPGVYICRCGETDYESHMVDIIQFKGELWVKDPDVGMYPLDIYASNLIDVSFEYVAV